MQRFQCLLADPNRVPERGEVYLSQCFRHATGLAPMVEADLGSSGWPGGGQALLLPCAWNLGVS